MAAIPGEGTSLFTGSASSALSSVAQIKTIGVPGFERASVSTTYLNSSWKEFRPGRIPDGGELTIGMEIDPSISAHMNIVSSSATASALQWFQVRFADLASSSSVHPRFQGFITAVEYDDLEDETNLMANVTVKVTGPIVYATSPA